MQDKALINEVRKRLTLLENEYEVLGKDLESTRGFLAMLERKSVNAAGTQKPGTHADIIGNIAADMLSRLPVIHRRELLDEVLARDVHVGSDGDSRKQMASLSSILSRDSRFTPIRERPGYWRLAIPIDEMEVESDDSGDTPPMLRQLDEVNSHRKETGQYQEPIAS